MTHDEYERPLIGQLCWACHSATGVSHARPRQCPRCRRKWRYRTRQVRWELLKAFCLRATAHHAARSVPCDYATAHAAYRRFRTAAVALAGEEKRQLLGELELDESYPVQSSWRPPADASVRPPIPPDPTRGRAALENY